MPDLGKICYYLYLDLNQNPTRDKVLSLARLPISSYRQLNVNKSIEIKVFVIAGEKPSLYFIQNQHVSPTER